MPYPKKIVLHCQKGCESRITNLVEEFIRDGVVFVGVVGEDCAKIEDIIDEIVVGNGDRECGLLTSSHPNESLDEVIHFADSLTGKFEGKTCVVEC